MYTVGELEEKLYERCPRILAQEWDNVGLLVGSRSSPVGRVLVALDITEAVAREAAEKGCGLILAHHPVINCNWTPVQTVTDATIQGRILRRLIQSDIAAICMHTNLDAAAGGVNDQLALRLGLEEIAPLDTESGIGRVGVLPKPMELAPFARYVKERLGANGVRFADGGRPVSRVAVGGGSCGEYAAQALALGCDTFVTADVKYNGFLDAPDLGLNLLDAGHFPTEDVVCGTLLSWLGEWGIPAEKSASHREVIQYV